MSSRKLHSSGGSVPPLSLPPGALTADDQSHSYDVERDPPSIEPIEHRIRLELMAGGPVRREHLLNKFNPWKAGPDDPDPWQREGRTKPLGLQSAEATCRRLMAQESRFYEFFDDDGVLSDAPAFLAHRLRACRDEPNPEDAARKERDRRENWYEIVIPWKNLYHVFKRSTYGSLVETTIGPTLDGDSLTDQNAFVGMVVIDDGDDAEACARDWAVPSEYVINEGRLSSAQSDVAPVPSDYGIELPAPLLVGEYASGSQYPFLPWADGLVCTCPYKHDKPWRVLCKHELLAAVVAGGRDSIFLPVTRGIEVPHRARRFVSPEFVD